MSYLLLLSETAGAAVSSLPPLDPAGHTRAAMKKRLPALDVHEVPGAVHMYRKKELMGKLPGRASVVTGCAFAVMARSSVPLERFLTALQVCEGKVRSKAWYFPSVAGAHLMKFDALCHDRAEQVCEILSGYETGQELLVVLPLVQSSFTSAPLPSWVDTNSEMSFSAPPGLNTPAAPGLGASGQPYRIVKHYIELPTCPSCLERLDASISGIRHMLCTHEGGAQCMCHFRSTACKVCTAWRLAQSHGTARQPETAGSSADQPHLTPPASSSAVPALQGASGPTPECAECKRKDSLWACMTCGFIGCGRYSDQHTLQHCFHSQHTLVMELGSQKIWDYDGDLFVHRIVVGMGCKSVLPDQMDAVKDVVNGKSVVDAKLETKHEQACLEFSHLVAQQLESGRRFHMDRIAAAHQATAALRVDLLATREGVARRACAWEEVDTRCELEKACLNGALDAVAAQNARLDAAFAAVAAVQSTHASATDVVKGDLEAFLRASHEEKKALEASLGAAKDEVRDLEAAVSMRQKCRHVDASQSMLFVGEQERKPKPKRRGKR